MTAIVIYKLYYACLQAFGSYLICLLFREYVHNIPDIYF